MGNRTQCFNGRSWVQRYTVNINALIDYSSLYDILIWTEIEFVPVISTHQRFEGELPEGLMLLNDIKESKVNFNRVASKFSKQGMVSSKVAMHTFAAKIAWHCQLFNFLKNHILHTKKSYSFPVQKYKALLTILNIK